jgi:eukaryotic-like serine/threonine-protein kinase
MASAAAIGPYRILEPLGHGGMGIVYRARHASSERAVALKTVKVSAPKWLDSIRREIDALTRIRHPGIVRIVEHGVHGGRPWYAMDLLEGESLRHFGQRIWSPYRAPSARVGSTDAVGATDGLSGEVALSPDSEPAPRSGTTSRAGGVPPAAGGELRKVLQLVRRVSATLGFLHGEGFVNCDLKPENVLLVAGQPVIIDFGLTAHHPGGSGREELDVQRAMSGTLPYMSPEQIRGEFVDARSDLYSLGCMLYELVTGRPPFVGAPRTMLTQHLSSPPSPPSELVSGVPPELERVVLKLLEKGLTDRFGYADEVAAMLAELSGDVHRLVNFPPARPYLYRPRFVGREGIVAMLAKLRDRAILGAGSIAILAGESGVGKTRVAMELTRIAPGSRMRVVASESSPLSAEKGSAIGSAPFNAVRPLLRAVADRCQEGGADVTEKLLGPRRSVLALYEPLLAQVPAKDPLTAPLPLTLEASRQRLFKYVSETLTAFAHEHPLLWVLDDLGWADELSLDFLRSLTNEYLEAIPTFILCTYRSEEATDAVTALAGLPHVTHATLPRLEAAAVSAMIADMLALGDSKSGFVQFVAGQAEGNPFFVAEHVRTAVAERVLFRDQKHAWQLGGRAGEATPDYTSLPLPKSLRELIDQRLRRLSPAAQHAVLVAAAMGRDADLEVLQEVALLPEGAAATAIDELLRRQILEQPDPGRVRFAHDKLREVVHAQAVGEKLIDLHARLGLALEARWRDRSDANLYWATLGHHFAMGRLFEPAATYLKLAADHARSIHANAEAIRLYRQALDQVTQIVLRLASDSTSWHDTSAELYEALADVLALTGKRDDARATYDDALVRTGEEKTAVRARVYRKIGKTWETQGQQETALSLYGRAQETLGVDAVNLTREHRDELIQVHIDRLWVYYWLNLLDDMKKTVTELRSLVDKYGSTTQQIRFLHNQLQLNLRYHRYLVNEETLGFARTAMAACVNHSAPELPMAQFLYGFALLLGHSLAAADQHLRQALTLAQRDGDVAQQARCLTYLTLGARMRGDIDETGSRVAAAARISVESGMREYLAAAHANQAWLALRSGQIDLAYSKATQALDIWRVQSGVFPFQWMALLPLMEIHLANDSLERTVSCVDNLLMANQQCLPGKATDALSRALTSWSMGDRANTKTALKLALSALAETEYA